MKTPFLIIFLLLLSLFCHAQIRYEKGYFLNDDGEKIDCFIKNVDWFKNPKEFEYKLKETDVVPQTANILSVKEFGISNTSKFKRFLVKIDKSRENLKYISYQKAPQWIEETLFLKTIVEGEATLYFCQYGDVERFFYSLKEQPVEQLVFKSFFARDNKLFANTQFRQQLWNTMKCSNSSLEKIGRMSYTEKDLAQFFVQYNQCKNANTITFVDRERKNLLNFKLKPGIAFSSLSILYPWGTMLDFGAKRNFRGGLEVEWILPFHKNKWSIFVEPAYQYFSATKLADSSTINATYKSLEVPLGVRHAFFLNKDSKIFLEACYVINFAFKSKVVFNKVNLFVNEVPIDISNNLGFGVGYSLKNKYSIQLRMMTNQDLFTLDPVFYSGYHRSALIFGYKFADK